MADLSRDHGLGTCGERRVANRQRLVVGEVPGLLLRREAVAAQVHRQHEIGLLHDLLAVQVEVGEVQQQRVLVGPCRREVPDRVVREPLGLLVHAQRLVVRDQHGLRRIAPRRRLLQSDSELGAAIAVPGDRVGRRAQVLLGHQVGVDVVVGDRAVLVRARHAVDAEGARAVVVPERTPETRRLDEQLEADPRCELRVPGDGRVAERRVGDVGADVERGRARGPVPGALLAADRAPRECGALQAERRRALAREVDRRVPPAERVARGIRRGVRERLQDEGLGVPERVPVVARAPSGPSRGSPASRPARSPAAAGTARSAASAAARHRPRPRRRHRPRSCRGRPAARRRSRPSRSPWPRRARPRPARAGPAASAGSTTRRR